MVVFSNKRYHNRIALIYDAGSPIGQLTVKNYAQKGSHLIMASPDETAILTMEKELQSYRSGIISVPTDICHSNSVKNLIEISLKHFARIDYFIYSNTRILVPLTSPDQPNVLVTTMETNCSKVIELLDEIIPLMSERRTGHIVLLSFYMFLREFPQYAANAAAEFALLEYLISLQKKMNNNGVKITIVHVLRWRDMKIDGKQFPWYLSSAPTERIAAVLTEAVHNRRSQIYLPLFSSRLYRLMNQIFSKEKSIKNHESKSQNNHASFPVTKEEPDSDGNNTEEKNG